MATMTKLWTSSPIGGTRSSASAAAVTARRALSSCRGLGASRVFGRPHHVAARHVRGRPGAPTSRGPLLCRASIEDDVWTQAIEENNAKMESGSFSVFPRRAGPRSDEELAQWNEEMEAERLSMMEHQLTCDLLRAVAVFDKPFMTTAFIAGDMVLLHVLARQGLLSRVPVVFIDTLHLFPETYEFAEQMERHYNFKLQRFHPSDVPDLKTWRKTHGSDLYLTDPGRYDQLAKVEPLNLALGELQADAWINGRRRDHGAERASLQVFEAGSPVKVNAIAHWSFEDCWNYIHTKDVPYHPLHDEGYPSVGDMHSTLPVDREKWFSYGAERSGRFQGLTNSDGSMKTECGIHVTSNIHPSGAQP